MFASFIIASLAFVAYRKNKKKNRVHYSNNMKDNKNIVLIIGATGAIGKKLSEKCLEKGWRVVAPLHRTPMPEYLIQKYGENQLISEVGFDITKWKVVKDLISKYSKEIFCVWNLAAPLSVEAEKNPKLSESVTIGGMKNILAAMEKYNVHNICFSDSIGSFGNGSPRYDCPASFLAYNSNHNSGSSYGKQKAACRQLLKDFSNKNVKNDTRFAVIPGVLHDFSKWGDGTTEYALEAMKFGVYSSNKVYHCPVPLTKPLPMIYIDDLICGLYLLMVTKQHYLNEPEYGYSMAGFSFNARQLFNEISTKYNPKFKFKLSILEKKSNDPTAAFKFANLWPCSLSPREANHDLHFSAEYNFEKTVSLIIRKHRERRKIDARNARNIILNSMGRVG
jgi:threonine 3-dehydrogenase